MISRVSSAYCTIGKSSMGYGIGAWRRFWEAAVLIDICRSSTASTNSKGESGSPCRTPLLHLKYFPETPLSRTAVEAEHKIFWIQ
jgi:hypothetical protein